MNNKFVFLFLFVVLSMFFVGCTSEGDTTIVKRNFNTFNSYFASGLSCSSFKASNLSGISGSVNRQVSFGNFPMIVEVDTFYLNNINDYSVSSVNSSFVVVFKNKIWNDQDVSVCLATSNTSISNSVYLGSVALGSDGSINRVLVSNITNPLLVAVDNQLLSQGVDYSLSLGNVTFINKLYNDMVVSVWG